MHVDRDVGLAESGRYQRCDEKAQAREAMGTVHHTLAQPRLNAVDLDIEIELKGTGQKPLAEEDGKDERYGARLWNQRQQPERSENCQECGIASAKPRDERGGKRQRHQRSDGRSNDRKPEL